MLKNISRYNISLVVVLACASISMLVLSERLLAEDERIARIQGDVNYLCSEELAGRDVPGPGGDLAARWLRRQFIQIGLLPAINDTGYIQIVPMQTAMLDTNLTKFRFSFQTGTPPENDFSWGRDFYTFPRKINDLSVSNEVVFADYGIVSEQLGRDDFGENVRGKAALVLEGSGDLSPREAGRFSMTPFKAAAARRAGAEMLIVLYNSDTETETVWLPDEIHDKWENTHYPLADLKDSDPEFPVIYLNSPQMATFFEAETKTDSKAHIQLSCDLTVTFKDQEDASGYNVCGKIEGSKPEYIFVGAHYDHLGSRGYDEAGKPVYYPGADDNASGIAGLLEIARQQSNMENQGRGLIFTGFAAEEDGLLGSKFFVDNLPVERDVVTAMLNMDMIGHPGFASMRDARTPGKIPDANYGAVYYSAASPRLRDLIRGARDLSPMSIDINPANKFPFSDAGSFHDAQIPTLHMFGGFYSDYSTMNDTPENLDWNKLSNMIDLSNRIVTNLMNEPGRIDFDPEIKTKSPGMKY